MTGPYLQRFWLGMSRVGLGYVFLNFPGNSDTQLGLRITDSKEQEIDDFLALMDWDLSCMNMPWITKYLRGLWTNGYHKGP